MVTYILKRLLFFLPTLFIISLAAFWISVSSPGDPVDNFAGPGNEIAFEGLGQANTAQLKEKRNRIRKKFNLDLPVFYFGISSLSEPDTMYRSRRSSPPKQTRVHMGCAISMCSLSVPSGSYTATP